MNKTLSMLKRYMRRHYIAETFTSIILIAWGIVLLHPDETFTLPSYEPMLKVAPEVVWGLASLALGLFQYVGMVGRWSYVRSISALLATGFWLFVGVMFSITPVINTFASTYICLGLMTAVLYVVEVGGHR